MKYRRIEKFQKKTMLDKYSLRMSWKKKLKFYKNKTKASSIWKIS